MSVYWGVYPGIAPWVQTRLRDADQQGLLTDPDDPSGDGWTIFDGEVASVIREITARYPALAPYTALTGDDLASFNEAAGLLTACRLLGPMTTGGVSGDLILEKTDSTIRQFSQNNRPGNPGERLRWEWQAERALLRISVISAAYGRMGRSGAALPRRARSNSPTEEFA